LINGNIFYFFCFEIHNYACLLWTQFNTKSTFTQVIIYSNKIPKFG
jgi:hypothetical protein